MLSDVAVFQYKCDEFSSSGSKMGVSRSLTGSLGIDWHVDPAEAILSEKDTRHPLLKDFVSPSSDGILAHGLEHGTQHLEGNGTSAS